MERHRCYLDSQMEDATEETVPYISMKIWWIKRISFCENKNGHEKDDKYGETRVRVRALSNSLVDTSSKNILSADLPGSNCRQLILKWS